MARGRTADRRDTVDELELDGRSLREWHDWLTGTMLAARAQHPSTSRRNRGRSLEQSAWLAIALELIYVDAYGGDDNVAGALRHYLELADQGSSEVRDLVRDYRDRLPGSLRDLVQ